MSTELLESLIEKTDTLIRLQAMNAVKHLDSQKEKIAFLHTCGIRNIDIAVILNTSASVVGVTLGRIKKDKEKAKK